MYIDDAPVVRRISYGVIPLQVALESGIVSSYTSFAPKSMWLVAQPKHVLCLELTFFISSNLEPPQTRTGLWRKEC